MPKRAAASSSSDSDRSGSGSSSSSESDAAPVTITNKQNTGAESSDVVGSEPLAAQLDVLLA
jgi:hypothetical protein